MHRADFWTRHGRWAAEWIRVEIPGLSKTMHSRRRQKVRGNLEVQPLQKLVDVRFAGGHANVVLVERRQAL